jgi:hypothetical protein
MQNPLHKENKTTPKDFFLWAGVIVTLYLSVISLIILLFEYISIIFPDSLDNYVDPYRGAIRFALANVLVAFPLYVYLVRLINVDARKHKEKTELKVRKWLISLSLFGAALTLVIDLIVLINAFLGGELTAQFILKVITVFVVIGGVFVYYLKDLKGYWQANEAKSKMVGFVVSVLIFVSVVSGFLIMGSPAEQRLLRFDQEKVANLSETQWQLINYWQSKGELPDELSELENSLSGFRAPTDPQSNQPYTYKKTGDMTFTLCANFNSESRSDEFSRAPYPKYGISDTNWSHGEGEVCFDREIDPDLYPIFERTRI